MIYSKNTEARYNNKTIIESSNVSSEGISSVLEETNEEKIGYTPEELYDFSPELGLARSEDLTKSAYSDFFRDPKIMSTFTEHLDMTDSATRKFVLKLNEADQNTVLTSLTSKLYDHIVAKVDEIDYGEIPFTKGDITKLSNYDKLRECIELLRGILKEFKQDESPINVVSEALANIETRKDLFGRGFRINAELPIIMYNNAVLSVIDGISYMIATSIEFIKTPNRDSFDIVLDKVAYAKTKSNMLYNNLKRFNNVCKNGELDKALEHIIQHKVKGIGEGAIVTVASVITASVLAVLVLIPLIREMVFFFYYTRIRVSDFFDIQADLLQMNAYNVENNEAIDNEERERIVSKQLKISEFFRKMANKITFTNRKAEVDATKEIEKESKKMKIEELEDNLPGSVSTLF